MTCHRTGRDPMGIMGFGSDSDPERIRIPSPPQNSTTFMSTRPQADRASRTTGRDTPLFGGSLRRLRHPHTQVVIELTTRLQLADPLEPHIARTFEVICDKADALHVPGQLGD